MTPNELNEKAKQYIESLTDDYFENTPKYKLVKNAFVTGVFFAESCGKTIEKLEKENKELRAKLERFQCCANCKSFSNCYNMAMQEDEDARFECWHNRLTELEKENAELKKELQSERYNLKCRDDELAEARAFIEELQKQIRRTTQKLNFAVQDFLKTKPAWFQNYNEELERRVRELETE